MGAMDGLTQVGTGMAGVMGLTQANSLLGIKPGWFYQMGGHLAGGMVRGMTQLMPSAISNAVTSGLNAVDLEGIFSSALSHPFAKFQMHMEETRRKFEADYSKDWDKAHQAAAKFSKTIGLSAGQMVTLRNEMINFANDEKIGIRFNKSIEEATALQQKYTLELGRQVSLTREQQTNMLAMSSVIGDEGAVKFASALDKFGVSTTGAGEKLTQMYNKSVKQGLVLEKYAKNVTDHLAMAQKYTFKDGTNGLMRMAEMATKIKMDMSMVAQFADRVSNVDDAVHMGAQLQVLGGPFAQFGDPLRMMYGSLNDMEDFSERFAELTKSLGSFDKKTGEFNIKSTFDRIRLKEASKIMGVDYEKMIEQATTQARRAEVEKSMAHMSNIPEEFKEWVKNNATFENGVAGIKAKDGTFKALNNLGKADFEDLINETKSEAENIADIAEMLRGALEIRKGAEQQQEEMNAKLSAEQAQNFLNLAERLGGNDSYLAKIWDLQQATKAKELLNDYASPISNVLGSIAQIATTVLMIRGGKGMRFGRHAEGGVIPLSAGSPRQEYAASLQAGEAVLPAEFVKNNGHLVSNFIANPRKKYKLHNNGGIVGMSEDALQAKMSSLPESLDDLTKQGIQGNPNVGENEPTLGQYGGALVANLGVQGYRQYRWMRSVKEFEQGVQEFNRVQKLGHQMNRLHVNQMNKYRSLLEGIEGNLIRMPKTPTVKSALETLKKIRVGDVDMHSVAKILKDTGLNKNPEILNAARNVTKQTRALTNFATKNSMVGFVGMSEDGSKAVYEYVTRETGEKITKEIAKKTGGEVGEGIMKKVSQEALGEAMAKGTTSAVKVGAKGLLKSIGSKVLPGVFSAGFEAWNQYEQGNFTKNRGEAFGSTIGAGVLGAVGTVLGGAFGGPVGAFALGYAGDIIGAWLGKQIVKLFEGSDEDKLAYRHKVAPTIKNPLGRAKFDNLTGVFRKKEIDKIAKALSNNGDIDEGEIPDWLVKKLQMTGNDIVLHKGKYANGGWLESMGSLPSGFINGKPHASGGVTISDGHISAEAEGGEVIGSKEWVKRNPNAANKVANGENIDIKSSQPLGEQMKVKETSLVGQVSSLKIEIPAIKIDLSGVINLVGAVNSSIDSKELENAITGNVVAMLQQKLDVIVKKEWNKRNNAIQCALPASTNI